jgi:hypothetical protein
MATKKKTTKKATKKKILGYCEKKTQVEPRKEEKMNLFLVTFKHQYLVYGLEDELGDVSYDPYYGITKMDGSDTPMNVKKITNLKELNKLAEECDFDDTARVDFTDSASHKFGEEVKSKYESEYIVSTVVNLEKMCD